MMMNKKIFAAGTLAIATLAVTLFLLRPSDESKHSNEPAPDAAVQVSAPENMTVPGLNAPPLALTPPIEEANDEADARQYFAPSLRGTEIDGRWDTDDRGNLVVSRSTRDLFDYFLSTHGQRSLEEIVEQIRQHARDNLPPEAAEQAFALLDDYIAYKKATQAYLDQDATAQQNLDYVETSEMVFRTLVEMRRQFFSPADADALFGVEEAYGEYALARMRVQADESLSATEKEARMAQIDQLAPPEIQATKQRALGIVLMEQSVSDMRAAGATDEEIYRYREQRVGPDEARRLADIDAANADWERRYQQYAQQRDVIVESQGLSEMDKEAALERVRSQYFQPSELDRVRVNDQTNPPNTSG